MKMKTDGARVKTLLLFGIIFLFFPSCTKQKNASLNQSCDRLCDADIVRQQEARLTDIPIPLNAKPVPNCFWMDEKESAGVMLGYRVTASLQEIVSFYSQEMERFGWDNVVCFDAHEHLLVFEKPGRVCSISLRPVDSLVNRSINCLPTDTISLIVFTGNKQSST